MKPRKFDILTSEKYDCESIRDKAFSEKLSELGIPDMPILKESSKYWDFSKADAVEGVDEYSLWHRHLPLSGVVLQGSIVRGFKRGSKQLGCPTANIEMSEVNKSLTASLVPGVYSAIGSFPRPSKPF